MPRPRYGDVDAGQRIVRRADQYVSSAVGDGDDRRAHQRRNDDRHESFAGPSPPAVSPLAAACSERQFPVSRHGSTIGLALRLGHPTFVQSEPDGTSS
jgi:hypothetical protein